MTEQIISLILVLMKLILTLLRQVTDAGVMT